MFAKEKGAILRSGIVFSFNFSYAFSKVFLIRRDFSVLKLSPHFNLSRSRRWIDLSFSKGQGISKEGRALQDRRRKVYRKHQCPKTVGNAIEVCAPRANGIAQSTCPPVYALMQPQACCHHKQLGNQSRIRGLPGMARSTDLQWNMCISNRKQPTKYTFFLSQM